MSTWLSEDTQGAATATLSSPAGRRGDRLLRLCDAATAALLLLPLALPLALLHRHRRAEPALGRGGMAFERLRLDLPATRLGHTLAALGASHWPVLVNILRGDMAWVGPRARAPGEAVPAAIRAVRPGLVNPWFIRRRTAVDFGTEAQADLHYLAHRSLRHDTGLLLRGVVVALLPPPAAAAAPGRVRMGDVSFDNIGMGEAVARLRDLLDEGGAHQVSFVNPACVNIAARHRGYRRVLARARLVLPDGIGIKIGADLLGTPLQQNVNGTDLFPRLCEMLQARGASVYLLGGQPGVAERVAGQIGARWPGLRVAGLEHGYFGVAAEGEVAARVRASGADVLLVARGVPGQDLFIDRYLPLLGVKVALGVGGLFDFASGRISRAPVWMRETGLEWVWRLLQEPGRMWQRYLVGNFSFLGRIVLQRLGLRRPAADAVPALRPAGPTATGGAVRAVIFATGRAAADLPVPADQPAALLPMGCGTVAEQLMVNLAEAAIVDVDLVACDRPEELRALLGDGSRWGLRLHWHLVKDPAHPYAVLDSASPRAARRLVIGHADRCPSAQALMRMAEAEQQMLDAGDADEPLWCGWASIATARLPGRCGNLDRTMLGNTLNSAGVPARLRDAGDGAALTCAAALLRAQPLSGDGDGITGVPPSWIRKPWGAMSPLAHVDPGAELEAPVLVGPGCIVERGARVGPGVVLSRDVLVSAGTQVDHALILPGSYVGAGLELAHCIVNGNRVRHLQLGVESALPQSDAVMLSLVDGGASRPGWSGRILAGAGLLVAGPALLAHFAVRRVSDRRPGWTARPAVTGRDARTQTLHLTPLRCAQPGAGRADRAWALLAGLLDVASGRRSWFGMRPRSPGQWYALRPEWQDMLSDRPVGLLHAPAWTDEPSLQLEACAAADVYATVVPAPRRLALAFGAAWRWRSGSPPGVARPATAARQ